MSEILLKCFHQNAGTEISIKMEKIYDVIIVGAGPAGLTAGLYCGRYRLNTLIIEKASVGGQINLTSEIENYPGQMIPESFGAETAAASNGMPAGESGDYAGSASKSAMNDSGAESGMTLTDRMRRQALHFGAEIVGADITEVNLSGEVKRFTASDGRVFSGRTAIIAGGAHNRPIGCENEEQYIGAGISYCATCDANFFTDLDVYVVGGGDSAVEEAMYLARVAKHVTVIHRRDSLKAAKSIQEKAFADSRISFIWNTVVEKAEGDEVLQRLYLKNTVTEDRSVIEADPEDGMIGLFGFVGMQPETGIYEESGIELENGYIKAGEDTHTSIEGVYAAGDIRTKRLRQVVTACADGAAAAYEAERYLG